jgi:hypothetical protein
VLSSEFGDTERWLSVMNRLENEEVMPMTDENAPVTTTIAESQNYIVWKAEEPDGETTYHLELGTVTLHFFQEEWNELLEVVQLVREEDS